MKRGVVGWPKYSRVRLNKLMINSSSPCQKWPRTQSMMKPKVRRLCCGPWLVVANVQHGLRRTYEDEMAAHIGRTCDECLVCTPQETDIVCLQYQDHNPVDAGNHRVQAERRSSMVILSPYRVAVVVVLAVRRALEGVVCSNDHQEEPGKDGEDLVGQEVLSSEFLAFCEWVVWRYRLARPRLHGNEAVHTVCHRCSVVSSFF